MSRPPVPAKRPHTHSLHGIDRDDPWQWLRERDNPEVIAHLAAENAWTDSEMAATEPLQKSLYEDALRRIKETDESVPFPHGDWVYYGKSIKGQDYPVSVRRKKNSDREEVLLDANELAKGHDYFSLGDFTVSPNHQILAYSVDTNGSEEYTLYFKDLNTGRLLDHSIPGTYGMVWANDNTTFFYATLDEAHRPWRISRLQINQPADNAVIVFEDPDDKFYVGVDKTSDDRFILIDCDSKVTSEVLYVDADHPSDPFKVIEPRKTDVEYSVDHRDDRFVIMTNADATNFRLCEVDDRDPSRKHWKTILAERDDVTLTNFSLFAHHMVVAERAEGLPRLVVHSKDSGDHHLIDFNEPVYSCWQDRNMEFDTTTFRFGYSSPTTPSSTFDYDMDIRTRELLKEQPVLGGFNRHDYTSERVWVKARDGAQVPVSLVYRTDLDRSRSQPMLMTGYGSYGSSYPVGFSTARLTLLDRGIIVAIAHIRGGQEMGRQWYEDGKYLNKKNTFNDFVDCARHLIDNGDTQAARLAILGGSAGGLLMGAVVNQAPELFKAVVAQVPFVDVVTTILDTSLPLSKMEWEEWGNPNEREYFDYMLDYSPYDNVKEHAYPAILATAGLNDPRVSYWEPAKWVARIRERNTGDAPILLKTNMGAGHGGASGRYEALEEWAFEYAFAVDQILDETGKS